MHNDTSLVDSQFKNATLETEPLKRNPPAQKSSETIAAKTRKTARLLHTRERERESDVWQKQPSKGRKD